MKTIKDILKEEMEERNKIIKPIDELLNLKYKIIIKELQNNCTHKWEDGSSAIIHLVDDDADGYNSNPTYKEWDLCEICDKVFEKDKEEQSDIKKRDVNNINLRIENIDFWSPNTGNKGGMRIYWNSDIGFGTLDIVKVAGNDGEDFDSPYEEMKLNAYTETMDCNEDKSFIRKILSLVADYLNVID